MLNVFPFSVRYSVNVSGATGANILWENRPAQEFLISNPLP